ncbi:MAG: photosynthetic complex assembly protein PuhC [Pseudomonadota bacterium]
MTATSKRKIKPFRKSDPMLSGILALMIFVSGFSIIAQFTGFGAQKPASYDIADAVSLRFTDEAGGAIGVYRGTSEELLHVYPAETGGFVRTSLRALAFDRRKAGIGKEPPFLLLRTKSGPLLLEDPSTNKRIALDAFGKENSDTFNILFSAASRESEQS